MKIGLLLFKNVIGGVQTVSLTIAKLLREQGHEVFFIFAFVDNDPNTKKIEIPLDFNIYEQPYDIRQISVKDTISFIAKIINDNQPDLVISTFLEESYLLLKARRYVNKKFKIIMMNHTGTCYKYNSFWEHRIFQIYNQADALVTVTKTDEFFYQPHLNIPVVTINNLPNEGFYSKINAFEQLRNKKILSLGRLVKEKGFDILIKAFSKVNEDGWTLHIYGDGPEKDLLENLIINNKMENKIFLHDFTQNVPETMNEHEMLIFPSLFESYGMVLLEGLLMGMPSISFNCPNGPAIIEAELPGSFILVPPENEELLGLEIKNLINDENKRKQLSQLARQYRQIINKENNEYLWAELFKKIFNNK